ncbi:glutaminyl-peptide cyclotransferase [bacterium]|nr:glutaminyl-peptide cyclotransferase [bacterium]
MLGTASFVLLFAACWFLFFPEQRTFAHEELPHLRVKIVSVRPHDPEAFTQGLECHAGKVYESTGLKGRSSLRQVDPHTGKVLRRYDLAQDQFGEGLARVSDRLIQLTWKNRIAFIYDLKTLEPIGKFQYLGEGWGLCFDGEHLIMSNGSDSLTFRDPKTFESAKKINVTLSGKPVWGLNELEYADGFVYANVWPTDTIVRIDLENGKVISVINVDGLMSKEERLRVDVLNGICYDPEKRTFLLTGKRWPKMFEVLFVP